MGHDRLLTTVRSVRHAAVAAVLVQRLSAAGIPAGCESGHDTISDWWRCGYKRHDVVVPREHLEAARRALLATPTDDAAISPSLPPALVGGSVLGMRLGKMLALLGGLGSLAAICGDLWLPGVSGLTVVFVPLAVAGGMVVAWSAPRDASPSSTHRPSAPAPAA